MMLKRPVFEYLATIAIAVGVLFAIILFSPLSLLIGSALVCAGCYILYRHYMELGTDADILEDQTPHIVR